MDFRGGWHFEGGVARLVILVKVPVESGEGRCNWSVGRIRGVGEAEDVWGGRWEVTTELKTGPYPFEKTFCHRGGRNWSFGKTWSIAGNLETCFCGF